MNSIVLWVGGLAAAGMGLLMWELWGPSFMAAGLVLLTLAAAHQTEGHNDE